mmetsp:Transcript_49689/g.142571  ORF Transcript_49689/g.142571 Transcript_49689/m.142571 type:complete len:501 (-) Transcript_49689:6-1508(-)
MSLSWAMRPLIGMIPGASVELPMSARAALLSAPNTLRPLPSSRYSWPSFRGFHATRFSSSSAPDSNGDSGRQGIRTDESRLLGTKDVGQGPASRAFYGASDRLGSKGTDAFAIAARLIAAAELAVSSLRVCAMWLLNGVRLALFAMLLLPPFLRIGLSYFRDPRVLRGIRFGPGPRSFCDIYCPAAALAASEGKQKPVPVVIAVMGGAWVIGHRAWNAQLGQRLMDAGVLVVAIDYRNFPFGKVPDMVDDLDQGVSWAFANVAAYGGDPANVVLTGQSAGAHLSSLLLLQRSLAECAGEAAGPPDDLEAARPSNGGANPRRPAVFSEESSTSAWSLRDIRGYVGVSGPYDLPALGAHLETRGLGGALLRQMCLDGDVERFSPTLLLKSPEWEPRAAQRLPRMLLFHGAADKTVPAASSEEFAHALRAAGAPEAVADVRPLLAHAEVIIEGPMRGEDHQVQLLLPFLLGEAGCRVRLEAMPPLQPLYPKWIISVASRLMPF